MLHAKLGRHPIQITIDRSLLSIVNGKGSKLSKLLYTIMFNEQEKGVNDFKWIRCINDILISVGRPDLFRNDSVNDPNTVKRVFHEHCHAYISRIE